jgi:flagellar biogenesis protein FliO
LIAATEAAPSLAGAVLRISLVVLGLAAAAGAWLYWQRRVKGPTRLLEILDRAALARGASVALLRVGERRLLVGVSNEGVRLLRDLEATELPAPQRAFADVLSESVGKTEGAR